MSVSRTAGRRPGPIYADKLGLCAQFAPRQLSAEVEIYRFSSPLCIFHVYVQLTEAVSRSCDFLKNFRCKGRLRRKLKLENGSLLEAHLTPKWKIYWGCLNRHKYAHLLVGLVFTFVCHVFRVDGVNRSFGFGTTGCLYLLHLLCKPFFSRLPYRFLVVLTG